MIKNIKKKWLYAGLTFFAAMLVTSLVTLYSYKMQSNYSERWFAGMAQRQTEILKEFLDNDLDQIGAGASFFYSVHPEQWSQFPIFAKRLMKSSNTIISIQWMERVEQQDIKQFVEQVRHQFPNYNIYTVLRNGQRVDGYVMPSHEPIFVARDIYPPTKDNQKVLGFYDARLRFQLILDNMRIHHQVTVSDKVRLVQDSLDPQALKDGMLIYHPVFDPHNNQTLMGVVIGVIRTSSYFENLFKLTSPSNQLEVRVTDLGFDAEDDPILFESANWKHSGNYSVQTRIELPNRTWVIDFRSNGNITANDQLILVAIASGGIVIGLLLTYIVFLQVRAQSHLAHLLDVRTEELRFLVDHDSLTAIYNRRAFNQIITQAIKEDRHFSLVGLDVDDFKFINDNYGHPAGDQMLCHIANTVKGCLILGDFLVRLGGDEFCIISSITNRDELAIYLDRIRTAMCEQAIELGNQPVTCSLSIGAAIRGDENAEQIMQLADAQLYISKKAGRNKVTIA